MAKLMQPLVAASHRWVNINFKLSDAMLECLESYSPSLPFLEQLRIDLCTRQIYEEVPTIEIFANAPRLRVLRIGFNVTETFPKVPWSQIREFSSAGWEAGSITQHEIIVLMTGLERCQLYIEDEQVGNDAPEVHLPNLHSLSLRFSDSSDDSISILSKLRPPNLTNLSFQTNHPLSRSWTAIAKPLAAFLTGCAIRKLTLSAVGRLESVEEIDVVKVLRATPELEELQLLDLFTSLLARTGWSSFGALELESKGTPSLVPKLRLFELRYVPGLANDVMVNAICARSAAAASHLKTITIWGTKNQERSPLYNLDGDFLLQAYAQWDLLRDAGLNVRIVWDDIAQTTDRMGALSDWQRDWMGGELSQ
ncbi:hypothetical protein HWV62_12264 [Athelia sp. TMB]|nr:hypothetical protein HWV62_12264 [Athelia sp. TMB]